MVSRIGNKIKVARLLADLTQEALAKKINYERQVISRMEKGVRKIDMSELKLIAEATNQPLDFFYEEEKQDKKPDKYIDVSDLDSKEIEIIKATIDKIRELKKERTA